MTEVLTPPSAPPAAEPAERVTTWTDWATYVTVADALQRGSRARVTFDDGWMEIRMPSGRHEMISRLLASMVEAILMVLGMAGSPGGSTTFRRADLRKGAEPDSCFWIAHADQVIGMCDFDAAVHPPPDLILEVDVAGSSEHRMAIWAAMGVPEVWRAFPGGGVRFCRLVGGRWEVVERSVTFPWLSSDEVSRHVALLSSRLHTRIVADFRAAIPALAGREDRR
jgi:Uma2 family endonuclease